MLATDRSARARIAPLRSSVLGCGSFVRFVRKGKSLLVLRQAAQALRYLQPAVLSLFDSDKKTLAGLTFARVQLRSGNKCRLKQFQAEFDENQTIAKNSSGVIKL